MTVRTPKPESAARILMRALSELGLSIKYTQAQELYAKVQGFKNAHAMRAHAQKSTSAQRPVITCPVIRLGEPPLTAEVLGQLEQKDDIRAIVECELNDVLEMDLDGLLDTLSERMTGSLCGITDIAYGVVPLPDPSPGAFGVEVVAATIEWETLDRKPSTPPSRRLAALEFGPNQFNEVLEVDFSEDLFKWLEGERSAAEEDGDLEVIKYEYDGASGVNHLTLEDLVNARLDADGKLTLEDGTQLYLIDQNRNRWAPKALEDRVNAKMQQLSSSLQVMKSPELSGINYLEHSINYFVQSFRVHPSALTARTLRKVAEEYLEEGLISQADHDGHVKETESIIAEWRKTWDGRPNPKLPFYGCELPKAISGIERVSSDARALDWVHRCSVSHTSDSILEWLEQGRPTDEFDGTDEVLSFANGEEESICVDDLLSAKLEADGRFVLKDGTEFYLIDGAGQRWFPKDRVR